MYRILINDNLFFSRLLPIISLIVFMFGYSIGFGSIPYLLLGEIFPAKQRGILSSIAGSFNLGVMFIVIVTYHPLENVITTAGTFWMYSGLCLVGIIFVITVVPETKGQDLDSIEKLFQKKGRIQSEIPDAEDAVKRINGIEYMGVKTDNKENSVM